MEGLTGEVFFFHSVYDVYTLDIQAMPYQSMAAMIGRELSHRIHLSDLFSSCARELGVVHASIWLDGC